MKRMQLGATSFLLLTGLGWAEGSQAAIRAKATICEDCSYQQALSYAKEQATPQMQCSYATEVPAPASEQCRSTEARYVVYSAASQQVYGFRIYHTNQGEPSYNLALAASNVPVEAEVTRLLKVAAEARNHLKQGISQIPAELVQQLGVYAVATPSELSAQTQTQSADQCRQNPHARAIRDALDSSGRLATLQLAASNSMVHKKTETVSWFKNKDGLSEFSLEADTFGLTSPSSQSGSVSVSGTFKVNSESNVQYITRTYYPNPNHDSVTAGLTATSATSSKVVDKIDYGSGLPRVRVEHNGTVIEGVVLRFIINTKVATPLSVSKCVHEELKKLVAIRPSTTVPGSGQEGPIGPVDGGGSPGGLPMQCTWDVYSNGVWSGSYQSDC
jgi:hypothetical protein